MKNMNVKEMTTLGILSALAMILSLLAFFPMLSSLLH